MRRPTGGGLAKPILEGSAASVMTRCQHSGNFLEGLRLASIAALQRVGRFPSSWLRDAFHLWGDGVCWNA